MKHLTNHFECFINNRSTRVLCLSVPPPISFKLKLLKNKVHCIKPQHLGTDENRHAILLPSVQYNCTHMSYMYFNIYHVFERNKQPEPDILQI